MAASDVVRVVSNIRGIYERRRASVYALCLYYASLAINYFKQVQPASPGSAGEFWHNQSGQAAARMHSGAYQEENIIAWFMAHGVQYGVYLELANDARHQAIRPVIQRFIGRFHQDLKKLYQGE